LQKRKSVWSLSMPYTYKEMIVHHARDDSDFDGEAGIVFVGAYLDFMRNNGPYLSIRQLVLAIGGEGEV
jgi:hypothetical protein